MSSIYVKRILLLSVPTMALVFVCLYVVCIPSPAIVRDSSVANNQLEVAGLRWRHREYELRDRRCETQAHQDFYRSVCTLRFYLGNIRWEQHDLLHGGARDESRESDFRLDASSQRFDSSLRGYRCAIWPPESSGYLHARLEYAALRRGAYAFRCVDVRSDGEAVVRTRWELVLRRLDPPLCVLRACFRGNGLSPVSG